MADADKAKHVVQFDSFQLDIAAERLWNGSDPIALQPKTGSVLRVLVDHAGALVDKETLLDAVWRDLAVEEKGLNVSIAEIRQALGDSARQPRYVETVHRRSRSTGSRARFGSARGLLNFLRRALQKAAEPVSGDAPRVTVSLRKGELR